jgi:hypothetical protein
MPPFAPSLSDVRATSAGSPPPIPESPSPIPDEHRPGHFEAHKLSSRRPSPIPAAPIPQDQRSTTTTEPEGPADDRPPTPPNYGSAPSPMDPPTRDPSPPQPSSGFLHSQVSLDYPMPPRSLGSEGLPPESSVPLDPLEGGMSPRLEAEIQRAKYASRSGWIGAAQVEDQVPPSSDLYDLDMSPVGEEEEGVRRTPPNPRVGRTSEASYGDDSDNNGDRPWIPTNSPSLGGSAWNSGGSANGPSLEARGKTYSRDPQPSVGYDFLADNIPQPRPRTLFEFNPATNTYSQQEIMVVLVITWFATYALLSSRAPHL